MKFSLWMEKRQVRNQRSATKAPKRKTATERMVRDAAARIHAVAGQGDSRTYGVAGPSDGNKEKSQSRQGSKENLRKKLKYGDF
jgi:exosome complex RNA-binding protein Csl4